MFSRIVWPIFSSVLPQHEKEQFCWHGHGGHLNPKWTDAKHQGFGTCAYAFIIFIIITCSSQKYIIFLTCY